MNIEAMAREAGGVVYRDAHDRLAIDCDNMDGMKFAALVRAEAMREAAGICSEHAADSPPFKPHEDNYSNGWLDASNECGWAILAAIDQPAVAPSPTAESAPVPPALAPDSGSAQ